MENSSLVVWGSNEIRSGVSIIRRNAYTTTGNRVRRNRVNLEWVDNHNLGDELAPVIYQWMLNQKKIEADQPVKRTFHLMTVGSMLGAWNFDAVVWGSGVHIIANLKKLLRMRHLQKFDIRSVRGPITAKILQACGHKCPDIYGDPAILMPLIYMPEKSETECTTAEKKQTTAVIYHYRSKEKCEIEMNVMEPGEIQYPNSNLRYLNIETENYKLYIDKLLTFDKVISSSLHGIILAEAYGIPAVFLNTGGYVDDALMKYYDWYYSTGRYSVKMARTLEEAIQMEPMPLPDLKEMQQKLMEAFPFDLWER